MLLDPDLRARREALAATVETTAAGIGMRLAEVHEIERGEASDDVLNYYAAWLVRMEKWTPEERHRRLLAAETGLRFLVGPCG